MDVHIDEDSTTFKIKLDKNTLTVSSDPLHHGFWQLNLEKGAMPTKFRGRYTKRAEALKAAKSYVASRTKE